MLTDQRNWISGLHGGGRLVHEGTATPDRFGGTPASEIPATAEEEGRHDHDGYRKGRGSG